MHQLLKGIKSAEEVEGRTSSRSQEKVTSAETVGELTGMSGSPPTLTSSEKTYLHGKRKEKTANSGK